MMNPPILAIPNSKRKMQLETDACQEWTDGVWRNGVIIELYSGMMY